MKRGSLVHGAALWLAGGCCAAAMLLAADAEKPKFEVFTVLAYEVDLKSLPKDDHTTRFRIVEILKNRANSDEVLVRQVKDDRIDVIIDGSDAEKVARIQRLIERSGTLEFRVLANNRDHKEIIERALAEKTPAVKSKAKDDKGEYPVLAWWVPLDGSERLKDKDKRDAAEKKLDAAAKERLARDRKRVAGLLSCPEICKRTVEQGDKETDQVLVVKDDFNVTGQYLADAAAGTDRYGKRSLNFHFNEEGGKRLSGITKGNLPEKDGAFSRKLGIIIDGRLYSAPSIQSTISDRGEITGEFTEEEIKDLVTVLTAGPLPVKIKLVEKYVDEWKRP